MEEKTKNLKTLVVMGEKEAQSIANEFTSRADQMRTWAENLRVDTPSGYAFADSKVPQIKEKIKLIEDKRDGFTKPAYSIWKNARAFFQPPIDGCNDALSIVKEKMIDYRRRENLKREVEERRLREAAEIERREELKKLEEKRAKAAEEKDVEIQAIASEQIAITKQAPLPTGRSTPMPKAAVHTTVKQTRKCTIVDADKVPREWCQPNVKAIEAYGRSQGESASIRGVKFWWDDDIISKPGRKS